jgi:hypothetical protein
MMPAYIMDAEMIPDYRDYHGVIECGSLRAYNVIGIIVCSYLSGDLSRDRAFVAL